MNTPKRKPGRPRGAPKQLAGAGNRTCVYLDDEHLAFIQQVAGERGISVSRAIRNLVSWLRDADAIPEPLLYDR